MYALATVEASTETHRLALFEFDTVQTTSLCSLQYPRPLRGQRM